MTVGKGEGVVIHRFVPSMHGIRAMYFSEILVVDQTRDTEIP